MSSKLANLVEHEVGSSLSRQRQSRTNENPQST
jgi:hypothetical protein